MPYIYDFSKLQDIKNIIVNPIGWINPLEIEYGMGIHGSTPSYFWRVKGTKHTFVIPVLRMNFLSSGNYEKHFTEILESFREDYIVWKNQEWIAEWMQKYRNDFSKYISI